MRSYSFLVPIVVTQDGVAERADGGKACGGEILAFGKACETGHDFIAGIKNDGVGTLAVVVQNLCMHVGFLCAAFTYTDSR
jgi:hypothetical protein